MASPLEPPLVGQLESLVDEAVSEAAPLVKDVEAALRSDGRKYVHSDAGVKLLHASVLLRLKTGEVAVLIERWGIEAVAAAFVDLFDRPIIEDQQIAQYQDVDATWNAFSTWAQGLWMVIENEPAFTDVDFLADSVFNHDKGYNRAVNFASAPGERAITAPPALSESIDRRERPGATANARALWLFQVLSDARLIAADQPVGSGELDELAEERRAELEEPMGGPFGEHWDDVVGAVKAELDAMGLLA